MAIDEGQDAHVLVLSPIPEETHVRYVASDCEKVLRRRCTQAHWTDAEVSTIVSLGDSPQLYEKWLLKC